MESLLLLRRSLLQSNPETNDTPRRILVIDDNKAIHDDISQVFAPEADTSTLDGLTREMLAGESVVATPVKNVPVAVEITSAYQGQEALELVKQALEIGKPFEMATVDMRMPPGWDGLETIQQIWKADPNIQIVLCTAYSDYEWSQIRDLLGDRDSLLILKKPFDVIELKQMTYTLTTKWRADARVREMEYAREQMQMKLIEISRRAGMAEVATGVLHNVGNILNSVNTSADMVSKRMKLLPLQHLGQAAGMIQDNAGDLGRFFSEDAKGMRLPGFLDQLASSMRNDQEEIVSELGKLKSRIDHIRHIIDAQQDHGLSYIMAQDIDLRELIDQVIEINACSLDNHDIRTHVQFDGESQIRSDRHLLMQILVNLMSNAKRSLKISAQRHKQITITVEEEDVAGSPGVCVSVIDNGVGIPPENLELIFQHGFTTREDGRGYGLHSAANAARSMGGNLTAHSDGPDLGAQFALTIPRLSSIRKEATT